MNEFLLWFEDQLNRSRLAVCKLNNENSGIFIAETKARFDVLAEVRKKWLELVKPELIKKT